MVCHPFTMQYILSILALTASAVSAATFQVTAIPGAPQPFQNAPSKATVGDMIQFDLGGNHAVVDTDANTYNTCTGVSNNMPAVMGLTSNGVATPGGYSFTFAKAGTYYIICPIGNGAHCQANMKFTVMVSDAAAGQSAPVQSAPVQAPVQGTTGLSNPYNAPPPPQAYSAPAPIVPAPKCYQPTAAVAPAAVTPTPTPTPTPKNSYVVAPTTIAKPAALVSNVSVLASSAISSQLGAVVLTVLAFLF
ncbi:hypothetical protein BC830DRAFT_1153858 [Chytriomyces sp. MP71]|nr:hypothetical protein BC830DRAFT_1153858 [Chytriomyces sp. MP71]